MKATFSIIMTHPVSYNSRSNMPGVRSVSKNGWSTSTFNKTVAMSPYLVCFIVSKFTNIYSGTTGNQKMKVYIGIDLFDKTKSDER